MKTTKLAMESIYDFEDTEICISEIMYDIAIEEETVTSVDDKSNKIAFTQKLKEKIDKLIKELIAIVDRCIVFIKNISIDYAII